MQKLIPIVYEDEYFIVFDKPAGLLVMPLFKNQYNTLVAIVNAELRQQADPRLYPCHRLDRDTSGLIIFAKGRSQQKLMMDVFRQKGIKKNYIAFIQGALRQKNGTLKTHIQHLEQQKYRKHAKAKFAMTHFRTQKVGKNFSVLEVQPITGRTNQIRIQFAQIGHPLLGERKYARGSAYPLKFKRVALHAFSLIWRHPVTHKEIAVKVPLAKDMEVFLERNTN